MDVTSELQRFILAELAPDGEVTTLEPGDDLLEGGFLDSVSFAQLISFVEDRFDVEIGDDELVPEHFQTIEAIAALIEAKAPDRS